LAGADKDSQEFAGVGSISSEITVIYRAKLFIGERTVELGDHDSEEEAEQEIMRAEAEHIADLEDAKAPSHTNHCYNCEGVGRSKDGDECNMCAGTGNVPA
jgi:hypothetical protein